MEYVVIAAGLVFAAAVGVWLAPNHRDGRWHDWRGKKRRYVNGRWQYRELTNEERSEDWANQQW